MDRREKWKSKPRAFESEEARLMRVDKHQARRQIRRDEHLNRLRQVSPAQSDEEDIVDTPEDRAIRLIKWQAERDLKKKLQAKTKRPAFVIGVPHHNFFSPATRDPPKPHCHKKPKGPSPPKRVTAVTARRLAAKQAMAATTSTSSTSKSSQPSTSTGSSSARPPRTPICPRVTRSRKKAMEAEKKCEKKPPKKQSLAPENYEFKGPNFTEPIPLFGAVLVPGVDTNLTFSLNDNFKATKTRQTSSQTLQAINEKTPLSSPKSPKPAHKKQSLDNKNMKQISEETSSKTIVPEDIPKKKSPEKSTEAISEVLTRQESTPACDSSIESVILRMSSQFEPVKPPSEDIREEKENVSLNMDPDPAGLLETVPAQFSPFIVTSRGKSHARKEQKQRMSFHKSSPKDSIPTKDTVMQSLNISVQEEKSTSQYYKHLVESEEARLKGLCSAWRPLQEDPSTPEDGVYMINQAIGQTNLLIRKKFERFKTLVNDCETGKGEQLVRCADLQGFWEMMQMEIRDCNARFTRLEEVKEKGWHEDEEVVVKRKDVQKKKKAVKKKVEGRSNMRAFIEAQRKKKMAQEIPMDEDNSEIKSPQINLKPSTTSRKSLPMPVSPHSRAKITPRGERLNLLKLVQLTESAKRLTQNSFAIVKVSQKCKTPEIQHDRSISYINSDQTPGKGILKKTEDVPKKDGKLAKLTYKVNFDETVHMTEVSEDEVDEDEENRRSLAARLARIDSLNIGQEEKIRINKKLEFDEDEHELGENIEASVFEQEAPKGAIEIDAKVMVARSSPSMPIVEVTPATPPLSSMLPPKKEKSPTRRKPESFPGEAPVIKITDATPGPAAPASSPMMFSPAVKAKRDKVPKGVKVPSSSEFAHIAESTLHPAAPGSSSKRQSALSELEESGPSPMIAERKPRSRRTEEMKTETPIIDLTTPQTLKKRGRSLSLVDLVTPSDSEEKKHVEKMESLAETPRESTPKEVKMDRRKDSVSSETDSPLVRRLRNRSINLDNVTYRTRRHSRQRLSGQVLSNEVVSDQSDDNGNKENCSGMENVQCQSPKTPKVFVNLDTSVRRSARKSVRFVPEDACATCNSVLLTPKTLKNRVSFFGDPEPVPQPLANQDLMTFDSPRTPRTRIRRSSTK